MWVIYRLDTPIVGVAAALAQLQFPALWAWLQRNTWFGLATFSLLILYHGLGCPRPLLEPRAAGRLLSALRTDAGSAAAVPRRVEVGAERRSAPRSAPSRQSSYSLYVSHQFALRHRLLPPHGPSAFPMRRVVGDLSRLSPLHRRHRLRELLSRRGALHPPARIRIKQPSSPGNARRGAGAFAPSRRTCRPSSPAVPRAGRGNECSG